MFYKHALSSYYVACSIETLENCQKCVFQGHSGRNSQILLVIQSNYQSHRNFVLRTFKLYSDKIIFDKILKKVTVYFTGTYDLINTIEFLETQAYFVWLSAFRQSGELHSTHIV